MPADRFRHCGFDTAGGRRAARDLLPLADRPTAFFAVNDLAALGAMCAARDLRLRVGADLAVVGFNDTPFAAELRQLLRRNAGPRAQRLRPELVARASSGGRVGPALG